MHEAHSMIGVPVLQWNAGQNMGATEEDNSR